MWLFPWSGLINKKSFYFFKKLKYPFFFLFRADDEGSTTKGVVNGKKSSQNDLYMRLGLLLGDNSRKSSKPSSSTHNRMQSVHRVSRISSNDAHASFSSLISLDHTLPSNNTSPVSTLTGKHNAYIYFLMM